MTLLHQAAQKAVEALTHAETWIGSAPHGDNCYVSDHYEGDPGDRCNCGKESALSSVECALSALQQQPEPVAPNEWAAEAATVMAQFIHLSAQPERDAWAQNASRAIGLLNATALQQQEVPREPPESELVCYEAYAALGMFLMELAEGGHPQAEKLLDNLSQARLAHKDVLPFSPSTTQQQEAGNEPDAMEAHRTNGLAWAVSCWQAEVMNRPLVNVHRRTLDDTWRQVIRYFGGEPDELLGPNHDTLHMRAQEERAWKP